MTTASILVIDPCHAAAKACADDHQRRPGAVPRLDGYMGFIGISPPMQAVYRQIDLVARSRAAVFLTGESGTGKEVCAEAIHAVSRRAARPFVAINCGAIPADLLESELFGHVKGSFTGALSDRQGAVPSADGGTLFLDEICEMEFRLQVKLLRFLQTGSVQRVGGTRPEAVDVRVICATNRNVEEEVAAGRFREDLYYRLAVLPIELPPLRARGHDAVMLANAFLKRFGVEEGKCFDGLGPEFAAAIAGCPWPGNVRQLQNVMRRAAVMFDGPKVPIATILPAATVYPVPLKIVDTLASRANYVGRADLDPSNLHGLTLDEIERIVVNDTLLRLGGSLSAAARALGVSPSTLYRKRERWLSSQKVDDAVGAA